MRWVKYLATSSNDTAEKVKCSIKDLFSTFDQIRRKPRHWSCLLKKSLLENFFSWCSVIDHNFIKHHNFIFKLVLTCFLFLCYTSAIRTVTSLSYVYTRGSKNLRVFMKILISFSEHLCFRTPLISFLFLELPILRT